uniref:Uncharacterized protein n=1 Tax=Anguilla anguilla TaxID=7936 RepID=A0A0E9WXX7_ANGAN
MEIFFKNFLRRVKYFLKFVEDPLSLLHGHSGVIGTSLGTPSLVRTKKKKREKQLGLNNNAKLKRSKISEVMEHTCCTQRN